jgi:hypothetical protein
MVKERVGQPLQSTYPPASLYLDEIEEIEAIMNNPDSQFCIFAGDYKFSTFRELEETYAGKTLSKIRIQTNNPYIILDLREYNNSLWCGKVDNNSARHIYSGRQSITRGRSPATAILSKSHVDRYNIRNCVVGKHCLNITKYRQTRGRL